MDFTKYNVNNYTYNDVYYQQKVINIPFSWEHKPGFSKLTPQLSNNNTIRHTNFVLKPPPSKTTIHKLQCSVQPSTLIRVNSYPTGSLKNNDPFIEAYKKCTSSPTMVQRSRKSEKYNGSWPNVMKYLHILSCKYSTDVMSTD
ncbi:hypothetical protein TanjilG_12434 [Lupinus angustifolius]|uniref:Uncharacterized protein n=1 Tax=Lupinus angustifolius TaxID=3871 RepID=A0A4P1QYL0_LUPAN|nr:hypothetical protein TanjilG_12434 [Lupinus angustifolius]